MTHKTANIIVLKPSSHSHSFLEHPVSIARVSILHLDGSMLKTPQFEKIIIADLHFIYPP